MIHTWILIFIVYGEGARVPATTVFHSKEACEKAASRTIVMTFGRAAAECFEDSYEK